jgi:subtilisin family serine protease
MGVRWWRRSAAVACALPVAGIAGGASAQAGGPLDRTGTVATRSLWAQQPLIGTDGLPLTGTGVAIAVIDTGIDPVHPSFQLPGGSKIVRSLSSTGCLSRAHDDPSCVGDAPSRPTPTAGREDTGASSAASRRGTTSDWTTAPPSVARLRVPAWS